MATTETYSLGSAHTSYMCSSMHFVAVTVLCSPFCPVALTYTLFVSLIINYLNRPIRILCYLSEMMKPSTSKSVSKDVMSEVSENSSKRRSRNKIPVGNYRKLRKTIFFFLHRMSLDCIGYLGL